MGAAIAIFAVAPELLRSLPSLDVTTLQVVETLGVVDLVIVPILGVLAYAYLFREFLALFQTASVSGPAPPVPAIAPADPPSGET